jgi:hypothetical protein
MVCSEGVFEPYLGVLGVPLITVPDIYILHLCYSEVSRRVCYKLYIEKIACKSI